MTALYYNGNIVTMDEENPTAEYIAVSDGKITAVGNGEFDGQADTRIDLQGKTVMPAFIDGHSHFAGLAMSLSQCDLSEAKSFDDIVRLMREFIKQNNIPDGEWVTGTNYDHNFLAEKAHPDKHLLDKISDLHPIVIVHASSHMGVANSMGLSRQNLTDATKDIVGGHYGRIRDTDELSGYMEENAFVAFRNNMPMPEISDIMALFKRAQDIYAKYGITTVQEGMVTPPLLQLLQYAATLGIFKTDVVGYLDMASCSDKTGDNSLSEYYNHLRIGGFKIFLDGSPQGRTAWVKQPYEGAEDGYCGYPIKTDSEVYELILTAVKNNRQLLTHCNGDMAAEQLITQFERVLADNPMLSSCRPVMIHAQLVQPDQLARMEKIGMMPSFFVAHTYYWGDIHIQNFGYDRAKGISPAKSAADLNMPFTFHQDSPVLPPDILKSVWCAVRRITKTGVELAREQCVSVYEALKANTVYAAYQYGEQDSKGTIQKGKLADFIILSDNPLKTDIDKIPDIKILGTFKEGECIYK